MIHATSGNGSEVVISGTVELPGNVGPLYLTDAGQISRLTASADPWIAALAEVVEAMIEAPVTRAEEERDELEEELDKLKEERDELDAELNALKAKFLDLEFAYAKTVDAVRDLRASLRRQIPESDWRAAFGGSVSMDVPEEEILTVVAWYTEELASSRREAAHLRDVVDGLQRQIDDAERRGEP